MAYTGLVVQSWGFCLAWNLFMAFTVALMLWYILTLLTGGFKDGRWKSNWRFWKWLGK